MDQNLLNLWKHLPADLEEPSVTDLTFGFPKGKTLIKGTIPSRFQPKTMLEFMSFSVIFTIEGEGDAVIEHSGILTFFNTLLPGSWMVAASNTPSKGILYNETPVDDKMAIIARKLANGEPGETKMISSSGKEVTMRVKPADVAD